MKTLIPALFLLTSLNGFAQHPVVQSFIDQVSLDTLTVKLREYSGEDSCSVYGNRVLIRNRVSNSGNDIAADYIKERFELYDLQVFDQVYSAGGRNIYAVQPGMTNSDSIYIICGHYDAVTDYGADDNASAIIAILEAARILSPYCFHNTIIYAAWDEEEIGLRGSRYFADLASEKGDRILGVLNIDMMAYDGDNDFEYDIDLNEDPASGAIRDLLLAVNDDYNLNLTANVIQPGTWASDHASFWRNDYGAVLFGEAWSNGDVTPGYHNINDRIDLLNLPYYHEMTKLAIGYIASAAEPHTFDISFTNAGQSLVADLTADTYQWFACGATQEAIAGETSQVFTPSESGSYTAEAVKDGCRCSGTCTAIKVVSSVEEAVFGGVVIQPNPATSSIVITTGRSPGNALLEMVSANGQLVRRSAIKGNQTIIDVTGLPPGLYFIELLTAQGMVAKKVIKH
jgi:hypothetical protein